MDREVSATAQPTELATVPEEPPAGELASVPVPLPAPTSRAQAVQDAILQASDASADSQPSSPHISADDSCNSDAESHDDILAQLSENMWAALRPESYAAAQADSLRKTQPQGLQAEEEAGDLLQVAQTVPMHCKHAGPCSTHTHSRRML